MPLSANEDEIKQFFYTFLVTLNPDNIKNNPIVSLEKFINSNNTNSVYWMVELSSKDNIEILINIDLTEWRGTKLRVSK